MSALRICLLAGVALMGAAPVHAEIFTHVDDKSGLTILSNVSPGRAPAIHNATPAQRGGVAGTGAAFPRVTVARQRTLDVGRRTILLDELTSERRSLQTAAARRAEGDVLRRHQTNITALERELRGVR